jgi:hypothetical protein
MTEPIPVALNDVTDVIRLLETNALGPLLRRGDAEGCSCMGTFHCNGNSPVDMEALPQSEQLTLKKARVRELQRQVEEAERQSAEKVEPA